MKALQAWTDYWNDSLLCYDHDFAIVNVTDDLILCARRKDKFAPSTISFRMVMSLVELADMLLPEKEEEHPHEQQ